MEISSILIICYISHGLTFSQVVVCSAAVLWSSPSSSQSCFESSQTRAQSPYKQAKTSARYAGFNTEFDNSKAREKADKITTSKMDVIVLLISLYKRSRQNVIVESMQTTTTTNDDTVQSRSNRTAAAAARRTTSETRWTVRLIYVIVEWIAAAFFIISSN